MRLNWARARRVLRRIRAGRGSVLRDLSDQSITLSPGGTFRLPPAIHLPGQVEKIKGLSPWRPEPAERLSTAGGVVEREPSIAFAVSEVDVVGAYAYAGASKSLVGYGAERLLTEGPSERIDEEATLVTSHNGARWFGCLLLDDFTFEVADDLPALHLRAEAKQYPQESGYRAALGLGRPRLAANARVRRLWFFAEPAIGDHRADRYRILRARLRESVQSGASGPRGVYLRRGQTGDLRILSNEAQVERALADLGFDILDPTELSVEEIVRRSMDAEIVAGVEGSQLSHGIFSVADEGTFLVLQPPTRFALAYKDFTDPLGMRCAFVVGDQDGEGFTVDLGDLQRTLDLIG